MSRLLGKRPSSRRTVDARTSAPFLNAKMGIFSVGVGDVVEVLANDSRLDAILPIWAAKVGHQYLGHRRADGCEHLFMRRCA